MSSHDLFIPSDFSAETQGVDFDLVRQKVGLTQDRFIKAIAKFFTGEIVVDSGDKKTQNILIQLKQTLLEFIKNAPQEMQKQFMQTQANEVFGSTGKAFKRKHPEATEPLLADNAYRTLLSLLFVEKVGF